MNRLLLTVKTRWVLPLICSALLSGCLTAAITAATVATIDIVHDRRTVGEYIDDNAVELKVRNFLIASPELRKNAHVNPTSWNGIVLLTGEVFDEATKQQVVSKAQAIEGVRQVVDETSISGKTTFLSRTSDSWITSKVKSKMVTNMGLSDANRIKVVTERSNVYLMGIVTQDEGTRATELARSVRGVARVVKVFEYQ